jgi:hypothetical protein
MIIIEVAEGRGANAAVDIATAFCCFVIVVKISQASFTTSETD